MKKIFLLLPVITICAIVYFRMRPEQQHYMDENEVNSYLNMGASEKQYMDESDVQAYTSTDVMKDNDLPKRRKTRYYPVKNYKPRESTLGFSITPPPGPNWYEKLEDDSLHYVKIDKFHKQYTIVTEAREVRLKKAMDDQVEIKSYVKSEKEKSFAFPSYEKPNLTIQTEGSLSQECVRYSQSYQDHGMKGLPEKLYVNVDTKGLFCLHPDNASLAIDIHYSEKSLSNVEVRPYSNEGEKFIASLKFR